MLQVKDFSDIPYYLWRNNQRYATTFSNLLASPMIHQILSVFNEHFEPDAAHDDRHVIKVFRNVCDIMGCEPQPEFDQVDIVALFIAAIFHDVVNIKKSSPLRSRASFLSAELTRSILRHVVPTTTLNVATHAILTHSYSSGQVANTTEAKLIQDADRLESLGLSGLCRLLMVSGAHNRQLGTVEGLDGTGRALDDQKYALDHLFIKINKLPDLMHYKYSRDLAVRKHAKVLKFLEDLREEL